MHSKKRSSYLRYIKANKCLIARDRVEMVRRNKYVYLSSTDVQWIVGVHEKNRKNKKQTKKTDNTILIICAFIQKQNEMSTKEIKSSK